ncbi:MAG: methyltransferase domain-containing protein [Acidobacteriaceae bacterium]
MQSMEHNAEIVDQFTRQAESFARAQSTRNEDLLQRIVQAARPRPDDTVLDVACGPGILACAFARVTRHATGIDLTPAMLDQARRTQAEQGLSNVTWDAGDITDLPYPDGNFDIVSCRFVFHHLTDPLVAMREMVRVCRGGGRIVVADSSPEAGKADGFNRVERLRDPSHTTALPPEELAGLFVAAGLRHPKVEMYRLTEDLDSLLAHSFPREGDATRVRAMFDDAVEEDFLDMAPGRRDGKIFLSFPIAIVAAEKEP